MNRIYGFPPICGEEPRILILGTMPSETSLARQQYYGHGRNAFWPIQFALAGRPLSEEYDDRRALLMERRAALWDVLSDCVRKGSLDSAINDPTPNDISGFLSAHPSIRAIAFNGKGAEKLYRRYIAPQVAAVYAEIALPSTSPAYTLAFEKKLEAWHALDRWMEG